MVTIYLDLKYAIYLVFRVSVSYAGSRNIYRNSSEWKTHILQRAFFRTHVRVTLDLLCTRIREKKLIQYCLEIEMKFAVDNTNPSLQDRWRYFELVSVYPHFKVIGYYFESTLEAQGLVVCWVRRFVLSQE